MYNVSDAYKQAIATQARSFCLGGSIRLQNGTSIAITDSNVVGELNIATQMMSGTAADTVIDVGACCAAKLEMTVVDSSGADSFADARINLKVGLQLADGTYEYVKMGVFYVDSATIKRVKDRISFTAYDKMTLLQFILTDAMRTNMSGMDAFGAAGYLCSLAGIQLAQTQAEIAALPNGTVRFGYTSPAVETARDLIMWLGAAMGCFSRITRGGKLEFVQIKAETGSANMIIPVREIAARQRYSTKFADSVLRISSLAMKKTDGKTARAYLAGGTSSKRSIELELEQNPLVLGQSEKTVANVLKDLLIVLKTAYFRPFESSIANDPALDAGDYVRLVGGAIDTSRGYATGMITHNVWRYRGKQDIVNVGSAPVLSQLSEDDTAEAAAMVAVQAAAESTDDEESGDISGEDIVYTQPSAQSGKKMPQSAFPPAPIEYAFKQFTNVDPTVGGGFEFKSKDGSTQLALAENGIQLYRKNAANGYRAYINANTDLTVNIETSDFKNGASIKFSTDGFDISGKSNGATKYQMYESNGMLYACAYSGGSLAAQISISGSQLVINYGTKYRLYLSDGEFTIKANGNTLLSVSENGMYVNGKRVLTEE